VQWTVALARNIPPEKLARVSSYDALGSVMAMPLGAVVAGPIAAAVGVSATQYGAAVLILVASALALIPRDVRRMRADHALPPATAAAEVAELAGLPEAVVDAEAIPAEAAADAASPVAVPSASARG
jgi:hypothetical protein